MRRRNLNLARRPFLNQRPVVRVTMLLWILAGLLLLADVALYWSFYQGQGQTRGRLDEIQAAAVRERDRIEELERQMSVLDLASQNEQVEFLNEKIAQRTFGWSVLFDTLAEILPPDVRLLSLSPQVPRERSRSARRQEALQAGLQEQRVALTITGEAKSNEAFYIFLDALLGSAAFRDVNPKQETRADTGSVTFDLATTYLPEQAARAMSTAAPVELDAVADEPGEAP